MPRVQPTPGTYRCTPSERYDRDPYDVAVSGAGCGYAGSETVCPWIPELVEFRRTSESGWQFGWVCFGGSYTHFAVDPAPQPGYPAIIVLDAGPCERI